MDISAINDSIKESFEVEIVNPKTGEGGWFVELAGPTHADSQAKIREVIDAARKRLVNTSIQDEKDSSEILCARILGWRGLESGGKEVPFTSDAALKIVSDPKCFWVRSQLLRALGDPSRPFAA